MYILGISAFYHDSAAALLKDGKIIAAAQEERFTRKKHDSAFPKNAVAYCLEEAGINLSEVETIVFYDKPLLKFERLIETYMQFAPRGFVSFSMAALVWIKEKLFQKGVLHKALKEFDPDVSLDQILFTEHHQSHAASAFYPSPYEEAVVLTMDAVGEWATSSVAIGKGKKLDIVKEIHFPNSLGLLYSAITYYTGFRVNSGEYKVMGLAPYGEPKYADLMREHLIDIKEDGSYSLDLSYFDFCTGLTMTNDKFHKLFGGKPRNPDVDKITQKDMDLAASIQVICEEVVLKMARALAKEYKIPNLCMAGGVALNCVANGKMLRDGAFKNIWVQPAAGDAGGALGAALAAWHLYYDNDRTVAPEDSMEGAYLGPEFEQKDIEARLKKAGAKFTVVSDDELYEQMATALTEEKAVGWHQGRMEFGPRALGGRSILGDPRSETMQRNLNLKVKFRESFRPFAPSVLSEDVKEYFEHDRESPYMLMVADVQKKRRKKMTAEQKKLFGIEKLNVPRSDIPSITHVDYSARIQTVHKSTNPRYHKLISTFKEKTGIGLVVNTSFNVRGEPIVCTPEDSFHCFMGTGIEVLAIGNCILRKEEQNPALLEDYKDKFELD